MLTLSKSPPLAHLYVVETEILTGRQYSACKDIIEVVDKLQTKKDKVYIVPKVSCDTAAHLIEFCDQLEAAGTFQTVA